MSGSVSTQTIEQVDIFAGFEQIVRHQPDRIAFKADGGKGESYTYGEILQTSRQIANNLRAEGIASDTSGIGLIGENCPEWPIAYLSILAAGQTVIPIDSSLKAEEIAQIVRHSGIKAAFCSGRLESRLRIAADGLTIFSFESDSKDSWKRLFQDTAIEPERQTCRTAAVIYTSGTTGAPKAVELTHKNIMSNVNGLRKVLCLDQSDVFLSILPLHHTFEATCGFLLPLLLGSTIVYARSFKSKEILEDIAKNKITTMIGVPLLFEKMHHSFKRKIASASWVQRFMFRFLYGLSAIGWRFGWKWGRGLFRSFRKRAGLGSIRLFCSGAASLPPQISRFFNFIGFNFLEGYGMTECSPVISVNRPDSIGFGSVGPPLANVEIRVESPDSSGIGEVVIRGDNVTPGYRGNRQMTDDLIKNGWLYTGDLGRIRNGHLWIRGRRKNVIVSAAGKNIYPEELEEKLLASNYILEALVFGRRKENKQGEEIRALIVPDMEQIMSEHKLPSGQRGMDEIRNVVGHVVEEVNERTAAFKRISAFDVQLEELEKTSTGKIKRFLYK